MSNLQISADERTIAFDAYNNAFYVVKNGNGYYAKDTEKAAPGRGQFWWVCEEIEAAEDAYDRTGSPVHKNMVAELLNGLNSVVSQTPDFAGWNEFNDDVMWAVIALTRGYEITGNHAYLEQARGQFNCVWNRAWDDELGGGLWWKTDKKQKNACVNGPAAIAALLLARNTNDTLYHEQAKLLYRWLRATLVQPETGQVADNIDAHGVKNWMSFTYNQGTYIGAATLLYEATSDSDYLAHAAQAIDWTRHHLTGQQHENILNDEYDADDGGRHDGCGFKGIFVRWAAKYVKVVEAKNNATKNWLTANANAAWEHRNAAGLMWGQWSRSTPNDGVLTSWECSSGVVVTQCAP